MPRDAVHAFLYGKTKGNCLNDFPNRSSLSFVTLIDSALSSADPHTYWEEPIA